MTTQERMGLGWMLWVVGWALLVGGALIVVPLYFVLGASAAMWGAGAVSLIAVALAWLSLEAARAVNAETQRAEAPALAQRAVSKTR